MKLNVKWFQAITLNDFIQSWESLKYLELKVPLWGFWLCSQRALEHVEKGHKYEDRNRHIRMMRLRKARTDVIHQEETETSRWNSEGEKEFDNVSPWQGVVLSVCFLQAFSVLLLLFLHLSVNCYWSAAARCLRPIAHLRVTQAENKQLWHSKAMKTNKELNIRAVLSYNAYANKQPMIK